MASVFGLVADFYSLLLFALDFWIVVIYLIVLISFAGAQNVLKMFTFYLFNENKQIKLSFGEGILVFICLGIFLSMAFIICK